ncbi:hypothetical protein N7526_002793 [Penicillium atrosanguineum]|nr:hypothetical protein N7526_002793 [Penicillium atrosanguineum]
MVIPIQSRLRDMTLAKASAIAPVASTDPAQVTFSWSGSSFESSPLSNPSAPPPTPHRLPSRYHTAQIFLLQRVRADSNDSFTNNAYLSDEDLLWMPENAAADAAITEAGPQIPEMVCSATMEQQLQRMRAIAEQEDRLRFLAKVEAHARATQALRQAKSDKLSVASERTPSPSKPRKRRLAPSPKRRTHSS